MNLSKRVFMDALLGQGWKLDKNDIMSCCSWYIEFKNNGYFLLYRVGQNKGLEVFCYNDWKYFFKHVSDRELLNISGVFYETDKSRFWQVCPSLNVLAMFRWLNQQYQEFKNNGP